jgi:hypothetical protein
LSRDISATNVAQIDAAHLHEVVLVKLEYDTPVYVHSGVGTITFETNDYLGVGNLGSLSAPREQEQVTPASIQLTLDGITTGNVTEALDSGNLYDPVTIYVGYRQDDGTLVDDPWVLWKGWYEYASISLGEESAVSVTCQHDLSILNEKKGDRYSDEDQQSKFTGDVGLAFTANMASTKLIWGGGPTPNLSNPEAPPPGRVWN